ncbi:hypothetical protein LOAG_18544 [Loa loa]|uniref:Uncharacterized protein n=1 Tax=Loa loa TaxID=7209 RepID=A0A1S0UEJ3_LOALO|nr:hypothetical protein LOAG_18544 [Loa loa]EJD74092.1 hypothetical protein LOAG_18544 [Loa loa]
MNFSVSYDTFDPSKISRLINYTLPGFLRPLRPLSPAATRIHGRTRREQQR